MNYAETFLFVSAVISVTILALIGAAKTIDYIERKIKENKSMMPMCFEVKLSDKQGAGGNEFKVIIQASSEADAVEKVRAKYKHVDVHLLSVKQQ